MFSDHLSLVQTALTVLFTHLTGWIIYCLYFHPLSTIPGPFLASFSRLWIVLKTAAGDMDRTQRALHREHGHIVRIAHNEVACSDPEAIKIIYRTKHVFAKSDYYDAWAPPSSGYVGHFPSRDEKEHNERRRIVNNVYSMSSVLESEQAIDSCTWLFCDNMRDFATQNSVVDLGLWINIYAFDVLGELFYGNMFGFMRERKDISGYMNAIDALLPAFSIGGTVPSYLTKPFLISTTLFSPSIRGALGAVKHLEKASQAAVTKRKDQITNNKDEKRDMLRKMLDISAERGTELDFTDSHVFVESHSSFFAGADTTAIAINSILYHLMRNPTAYSKLTAEVDAAISDGTLSMPITYREAVKLSYLNACVNEGMRLHPSVGLHMPRIVPPGGATISGFHFPAGYRIGINAATVQYDEEIFGSDAYSFNPDRWIKGDALRMERAIIVFGTGPRTCIGKNISLSEIYKLVPQIVRDFEIRLVEPEKGWKTTDYWFHKQTGINVYVRERDHGND